MNNQILFYSTNLKSDKVEFEDALLKGLAGDGGLYMPEEIPTFTADELADLKNQSYDEIAYTVARKFLHDQIEDAELKRIVTEAYDFDVPLENVCDRKYIMRLDRGPTASFKDFAARMMGRLMQYYLAKENRKMVILTATSGDTGSAVASAFYGLDNIEVIILFPENEVTDRQRKQMTTLHDNVHVLALDGKFDDCQALVKQAFSDRDLDYLGLSSANSINIGRLLPQSVYYVYAWSRLAKSTDEKIIFSVPSGNFGDLMGGLIACNMGLPIEKFVIATNANDEVPVYFASNIYKTIVPSKACISSAMNVGHPSNMARIIALYGGRMNEKGDILKEPDTEKLKADMAAYSVSDDATRETIKTVWEKYKVILEPHGAVGWKGLENFVNDNDIDADVPCVSLETAHPAKFPNEVIEQTGIDPELPESLSKLEDKEERVEKISKTYADFKRYLINKLR